jgi:hypothetical protein
MMAELLLYNIYARFNGSNSIEHLCLISADTPSCKSLCGILPRHLEMKIRPDQLPEKGYFLLDKLEHKELPVFLRKYLNKRTTISIVFYGLNIFFLLIAFFLFVVNFQQKMLTNLDWAYHYFIGFSIAFLLVPLYEYIHVLSYKSQGAKNTSYDSNIKKFYFLALADKFVANKNEFRIVVLAPFISITIILLLLLSISSYNRPLTILGILLCYTAMSSGDFAMLFYFEFNSDKEVVTYDNVE